LTDWPSSLSLRHASLTPDQLCDAASGTPLAVDVLSAGAAPSRIKQIRFAGGGAFDLMELNCHVRASGGLDHNSVAILVVTRSSEATICGAPLDDAVILTIPGGTEITASLKPGLCYATAVIPTRSWIDVQAVATGGVTDKTAASPSVFRIAAGEAEAIRGLVEAVANSFAREDGERVRIPALFNEYLGKIAEACAEDREVRLDRSLRHRLRHAWLAQDFIRAHLREEIPIMRLCKEANISRRQLEYAFRTAFDVSPHEFIQTVRLNESRRQLMTARRNERTVTQSRWRSG